MCGTGPGSKRLGIDGDREAIPLTLQIIYSKVRLMLWPIPLRDLLLILPCQSPTPCLWVLKPEGRSRLPGSQALLEAERRGRGGSGPPSPPLPPKAPSCCVLP